jgi:hypothetical protein
VPGLPWGRVLPTFLTPVPEACPHSCGPSCDIGRNSFACEHRCTELGRSRLGSKAEALSTLALHGLRCAGHDDVAVEAAIRAAARRHQVAEGLALALARVESSLIHTRISSTGAMGLMQLMPNTARELGVQDPFDVEQNADGGVRYLKQLLTSYRGDVKRALAAYNAGSGRVPRQGSLSSLPLETRTYVFRVVAGM